MGHQKKNGLQIFFWHHTHPQRYFSLFFVNFSPRSLMRYFWNGPLKAHLEPCQKPVKREYQARKQVRYLRTASI